MYASNGRDRGEVPFKSDGGLSGCLLSAHSAWPPAQSLNMDLTQVRGTNEDGGCA